MADKKPKSQPPARANSMMDMGDLSPMYPTAAYSTESSMRSTLQVQPSEVQPNDPKAIPRNLPVQSDNIVEPQSASPKHADAVDAAFNASRLADHEAARVGLPQAFENYFSLERSRNEERDRPAHAAASLEAAFDFHSGHLTDQASAARAAESLEYAFEDHFNPDPTSHNYANDDPSGHTLTLAPTEHEHQESGLAPPSHVNASPAISPTWTAINTNVSPYRAFRTDTDTFAQTAGYNLSGATLHMNEILGLYDEDIDTSNNLPIDPTDEKVYHINHKRQPDSPEDGVSYSVTLRSDPNDVPAQAVLFMHKKHADEILAERQLKVPELEEQLRFMLANGAKLMVERIGDELAPQGAVQCILPGCPYGTVQMPAKTFFLSLHAGLVDWQHHPSFLMCLDCFENMWDCQYTIGKWPPASIKLFPKDHKPRADSAMSYHDLPAITITSPAADISAMPSTPGGEEEDDLPRFGLRQSPSMVPLLGSDSPHSTDSFGEFFYPPVRSQWIASFFVGKTRRATEGDALDFGLEVKDEARVKLWKAVSADQIRWEEHKERTRVRRTGGELGGVEEKMEEVEEVHLEGLERVAELEAEECQGNRLSFLLRR